MPGLLAWEPAPRICGSRDACRDGLFAKKSVSSHSALAVANYLWGAFCKGEPDCLDLPKYVKANSQWFKVTTI
jgi:hypothetical protein